MVVPVTGAPPAATAWLGLAVVTPLGSTAAVATLAGAPCGAVTTRVPVAVVVAKAGRPTCTEVRTEALGDETLAGATVVGSSPAVRPLRICLGGLAGRAPPGPTLAGAVCGGIPAGAPWGKATAGAPAAGGKPEGAPWGRGM